MYDPALLPRIEKVVILNLGDALEELPKKYKRIGILTTGCQFPIYAAVEVEGDEASEVAEAWRRLPPGLLMRCHVPPYGLRFYGGGRMIVEASVCWLCNSIVTGGGSGESTYTFDASAGVSQRLLEKLREIAGRNPPEIAERNPRAQRWWRPW